MCLRCVLWMFYSGGEFSLKNILLGLFSLSMLLQENTSECGRGHILHSSIGVVLFFQLILPLLRLWHTKAAHSVPHIFRHLGTGSDLLKVPFIQPLQNSSVLIYEKKTRQIIPTVLLCLWEKSVSGLYVVVCLLCCLIACICRGSSARYRKRMCSVCMILGPGRL